MVRILALALIVLLSPLNFAMAEGVGRKLYEFGELVSVLQPTIDQRGGTIQIDGTGTKLDGVQVVIPPGAVKKNGVIDIGYETGHRLKPFAGQPSGITLFVDLKDFHEFQRPVEVIIPLTLPESEYFGVIGWMIDEDGRLDVAMMHDFSKKKRIVSFITFRYLLLTWEYFEED